VTPLLASSLLGQAGVDHRLLVYQWPVSLTGTPLVYTASARGRQRDDGNWEGWIEFTPSDGGPVVRSPRETTQPSLAALEYWTSGLTHVYLEGALDRALTPPSRVPPRAADNAVPEIPEPILNPFAVYPKGEELLRRQLGALSPRHLRSIARAYELVGTEDLETMSASELVALIVASVRARLAA
jgi:hypothetical protein